MPTSSRAGYSGTPLAQKLGIKTGFSIVEIDSPANYHELLRPLPAEVTFTPELAAEAPFVHVFVTERVRLRETLASVVELLARNGTLWVSWPKKAARVPTDLDGNIVRRLGLEAGLVDVKVCAVDQTWSGLKFVFRLRDR